MSFTDSIYACITKYVTFSGRASRSEFWWFFLFVILLVAVCSVIDQQVFGPGEDPEDPTQVFALIAQLITLLPLLAVGWRRMHDTGRSGWYLLLPMLVSFATMAGLMLGVFAFGGLEQVVSDPDALRGPAAFLGLTGMIVAGVVQFVLGILILWWLTRPSDPTANQYGEP